MYDGRMLSMLCLFAVGPHCVLSDRTVNGAKCKVIQADLKSGDLKLTLGLTPIMPGGDSPFADLIKNRKAVAAVNGAYSDKTTKKPIGDIWMDGRLVNRGLMGSALCIGSDGSLNIQRVVRHKTMNWSNYETVLACGPALMLDGKVDCDWRAEGFRDPHVTGKAPRMGVGYTAAGKLIFAHSPKAITFEEFASVMKGLGCYEAMNLDAGASLGMWFDGKTVLKPERRLTNVLLIEKI